MGSDGVEEAVKGPAPAAAPAKQRSKPVTARKARPKRRAKRRPLKGASATKKKVSRKAPAKVAPKSKVRRKQSTIAQRAKILAVADRDRMTARQVQKRFGVKPVTYYSWRKAGKKAGSKSAPTVGAVLAGLDIAGELQLAVRAQIQQLLPQVVERELASVLAGVGAKRRGRPRRGL